MASDTRARLCILAALDAAPLDRIRLMKALFLTWYKQGQPADGPFHFEPYLYGPFALDVYAELEAAKREGLIAQPPYPIDRRTPYYLTAKGLATVMESQQREDVPWEMLTTDARWAAQQSFSSLLTQVYQEAPEFAQQSVLLTGAPSR